MWNKHVFWCWQCFKQLFCEKKLIDLLWLFFFSSHGSWSWANGCYLVYFGFTPSRCFSRVKHLIKLSQLSVTSVQVCLPTFASVQYLEIPDKPSVVQPISVILTSSHDVRRSINQVLHFRFCATRMDIWRADGIETDELNGLKTFLFIKRGGSK